MKFKELDGCDFVTITEVTNVKRWCSEANKFRYVHSIRGTPRDIAIKERDINYIKIEIILLVDTIPLDMDKFKSKTSASVSEE